MQDIILCNLIVKAFGCHKCAMQDIILYNNGLRADMEKGAGIEQVMEHWDMLQINCAAFVNSDLPGLQANHAGVPTKPTR